MQTHSAPVPVMPGRPGRRGVEFASTRRLVEIKRRYEAIMASEDGDPALRTYELRRRNRPEVSAA